MSTRQDAELSASKTIFKGCRKHKNREISNSFGTNPKRTIFLSSFPLSMAGNWCGLPITPVVIASTLHRTFNVKTDAGMVVFHDGGNFCSVELGNETDARFVMLRAANGILPTLRHRNVTIPDWALQVDRECPDRKQESSTGSSTASIPERDEAKFFQEEDNVDPNAGKASSLIQLSGLPGVFNREWEGVRMTESVVASMVHRTYGVRTSPEGVTFNEDRTRCLIDLQVTQTGNTTAGKEIQQE